MSKKKKSSRRPPSTSTPPPSSVMPSLPPVSPDEARQLFALLNEVTPTPPPVGELQFEEPSSLAPVVFFDAQDAKREPPSSRSANDKPADLGPHEPPAPYRASRTKVSVLDTKKRSLFETPPESEEERFDRETAALARDSTVKAEPTTVMRGVLLDGEAWGLAKDHSDDPYDRSKGESEHAKGEEPWAKQGVDRAAQGVEDAAKQGAPDRQEPVEDQPREARDQAKSEDQRPGKKRERDEGKPQPRSHGAHDEVLHDEFFRQGERVSADHIREHDHVNGDRPSRASELPIVPSRKLDPAVIERRKKFRRMAAYILIPAAAIVAVALAKVALSSGDKASSATPSPTVTADTAAPPQTIAPATTTAAPAIPTPPAPSSEPPPASASAAPADSVPPVVDAATEVDVRALKKQAYKLLNQGKIKDALVAAQAVLDADPSDADLYLYVGTALEELGRRPEAIKVYSRCVHEATKGPKNDCRSAGGK